MPSNSVTSPRDSTSISCAASPSRSALPPIPVDSKEKEDIPTVPRGANLQGKEETTPEDHLQQCVTPTTMMSSYRSSKSSKSSKSVRRIQVLVSTGSSKIAISGVVDPVEHVELPLQDTVNNTSDQVESFSLFEADVEGDDGSVGFVDNV